MSVAAGAGICDAYHGRIGVALAPVMGRLARHDRRDVPEQTLEIGRGDKIRTCDPLHPMQVRYQAAPRPDRGTE